MRESEVQTKSAELYFTLLDKKFIPKEHPLSLEYIDSEEIRACVKRLADSSGVKVVEKNQFIHMLVKPQKSIYANSISDLKSKIKTYDSKIDLYLVGIVMMVLFAEADSEMATKVRWENEGISYHQLEELMTKTLNNWKQIDDENNGQFSNDWSIAVKQMYSKWNLLQPSKTINGKIKYTKYTRLGVIDVAMKELEKDKMVFIRPFTQTSIVTPTLAFYERLQARFGNMEKHRDRYLLLKSLIEDVKEDNEVGA